MYWNYKETNYLHMALKERPIIMYFGYFGGFTIGGLPVVQFYLNLPYG